MTGDLYPLDTALWLRCARGLQLVCPEGKKFVIQGMRHRLEICGKRLLLGWIRTLWEGQCGGCIYDGVWLSKGRRQGASQRPSIRQRGLVRDGVGASRDEMVGWYADRIGNEHDAERIKISTNLICKMLFENGRYWIPSACLNTSLQYMHCR